MTSKVISSISLGRLSFRLNPRLVLCLGVTLVLLFIAVAWSVTQGEYSLTLGEVLTVFAGGGSTIERAVVFDLRLGRSVVACAVGAALAYSGALTQSTARNPLASPDILGITHGAAFGGALAIIFAGSGSGGALESGANIIVQNVGLPGAAIAGALTTASVIALLARSVRGSILQVVLVGVGASIFLSSLTSWLLAWAQLDRAANARLWLTGSLNGRDWSHGWAPLVVLLIAIALAGWLSFQLSALVLGNTTAHVLGHRVGLGYLIQLLTAVVLAAVAVSAAGPIGFIAFVSPHLARGLAGTPTPPLVLSASIGAVVLLGADLIARVLLPWELPVGVVTAFVGAPFLLFMIIRIRRKETV
ncbi:FecCD family ABC transporter permease [Corynebacterium cystitidis]|uniref:Iron complex transport system permease protein n=1 Tax=Corynebacterium cystitidis DSM 20524 TaxID=1121357 RepID=A0A1H9VTS2_9CORY|nr:iron ABC transporter permease [Corynebacterium cystitidis]WJY81092.1 putative siderophore transport system permease protein YfhA [Corynebacterium cystitidis DSM 20524]SES24949.1 iron complex transport system permease protein [Corynebacterium cystitidis DSM 20524]SNV90037.1 iron ABC transporter permease [Corynebacterium cystitidis]